MNSGILRAIAVSSQESSDSCPLFLTPRCWRIPLIAVESVGTRLMAQFRLISAHAPERDVRLYNFYPLVHLLVFRAECKGESGPFGCSPSEDSLLELRHHPPCSHLKSSWCGGSRPFA